MVGVVGVWCSGWRLDACAAAHIQLLLIEVSLSLSVYQSKQVVVCRCRFCGLCIVNHLL